MVKESQRQNRAKGSETLSALCNDIERFIQDLLTQDGQIELRRNELAQQFRCAPSQINYVLATRFTLDRGYIIESRRGGGGFIRVVRLAVSPDDLVRMLLSERIGASVPEETAQDIIERLTLAQAVTQEQAALMQAAAELTGIALPPSVRDALRASILRAMLTALLKMRGTQA